MNEVAVATLSPEEARSLTDEVKGDAERLWRKLVELYDGEAHLALGYSSWGAYFKDEFGGSERHAYRLLDSGRVLDTLKAGDQLVTPTNEAQARELAPLLDEPEALREAWAEASVNGTPTAAKVREVVRKHAPSTPRPEHEVPTIVRAIQALYRATQETPMEEMVGWRGNSRRLAMQWACVNAYVTNVYAAREEAIPAVLKGEVVN